VFELHLATARLGMLKGPQILGTGGLFVQRLTYLKNRFYRPFQGGVFFYRHLWLKPQA